MYYVKRGTKRSAARAGRPVQNHTSKVWKVFRKGRKKALASCNQEQDALTILDALLYQAGALCEFKQLEDEQ